MRIGIFGGSFDPIHTGHAMVANYMSQHGGFDRVWLMPGRLNPLKREGRGPAPADDRLEMARLVAADCASAEVCDIEMHLPEPSYTFVTLCRLREAYPEHTFRIIIGSDNWELFGQWRDAGRIIREFGVTVYLRPGHVITAPLPGNVEVVKDGPQIAVSSTLVRGEIAHGRNVNFLVPEKVVRYIKDKKLYLDYGRD